MKNIAGKRVREARIRNNPKLTQEQLAVKLQMQDWKIDRGGIAKIETGIRQVTDIELVKIAKALNVSVTWLLGIEK